MMKVENSAVDAGWVMGQGNESENQKEADDCNRECLSVSQNAIPMIEDEDRFDDEIELDEEQHTPGKQIIEGDMQGLKTMAYFQADNLSRCLESRSQILGHNTDKFSDDMMKIELHGEAINKNDTTQILESEVSLEDKAEQTLVEMLWKQIQILALKEREVEQALNKERIESLVSKVEEEVEFEGIVENMCSRLRAEGEFMDMERRERDWEKERREVRLEEEVELLQKKVETLQEKLCVANESKGIELCKKVKVHDLVGMQLFSQLETNNAFQNNEELLNVGGENFLEALRKILSLLKEKAEQDQRILEDILQNERQMWIIRRQELENQIHSLDMELKTMNNALKEKKSALSLERQRRKQYGIEVEKVLALWRDENLIYNAVCHRLMKIQDTWAEFLQKVTPLIKLGESKGDLSELLENLSNIVNERLDLSIPSKGCLQLEWDLVEEWKAQRDQLEGERNILEVLLEEATIVAKENEKKLEIIQQENARNFVEKRRILDAHNCSGHLAPTSGSLSQSEMLEIHAAAYKNAWLEERQKMLEMMAERERMFEDHSRELTALLDEKDEELVFLRFVHQKLEYSLYKSKQWLMNLKKQLIGYNSGILEGHVLNEHNSVSNANNLGDSFNVRNDLGLDTDADLVTLKEIPGQDDCGYGYVNVEQLAEDISKEIGRLSKELWKEQDRLEKERIDIRTGTEQLKQERRELEKKVADTLTVMEELREKIKEKEGLLEWERKQMDSILASRMEEEEHLKQQLNSKEQEIKNFLRKFGDEISATQNELEKERKEREDSIEMHYASRRKLIEETREREMKWESEMEAVSQEMRGLRVEFDERNKQISRLKKELEEFQQEALHDRQMKQEECSFENSFHNESSPEEKQIAVRCVNDLNSKNMETPFLMKLVRYEWQNAIGKIAEFDEQIAEAMIAIQSLREELDAKEKQLQKAWSEQYMDKGTMCKQEQSQSVEIVYRNRIIDVLHESDHGQGEHLYLGNNEHLLKLLEAERADTCDAMSILQGAVRELQWALYDYKGKDGEASSLNMDKEPHCLSSNGDLVKVHASHLDDLDRFIIDLKLKAEEAEKRARDAEVALAVKAVKESAKCTEPASALVKLEKAFIDNEALGRGGMTGDIETQHFSSSLRKVSQIKSKDTDIDSRNIRTLRQEQKWSGRASESLKLWDVNAEGSFSAGTDAMSNWSSNSWAMTRGCTEGSFPMQDTFLILSFSTPATSQRRWLVDGLWLENVRKEQTLMRQQLELERLRVSELKQVEAENRWMEATIRQALEQKKISDIRVQDLEKKVSFLETMIIQRGSN